MGEALKASEIIEILKRADRPAPRYTSYPPANHFHEMEAKSYEAALARASKEVERPLSAYLHLPFCYRICTYCGCHSVKASGRGPVAEYLDNVEREVAIVRERLGERGTLNQLQWGGGTPNYLNADEIERCFRIFDDAFEWAPESELGIEMDPTVLKEEQLVRLKELGFNRLSFGVQDMNDEVQKLIGRFQSRKKTLRAVELARKHDFPSLHLDLVYGLPGQTLDRLMTTLQEVVELSPDRLSLFGYAHLPSRRPLQQKIDASRLPSPEVRAAHYAEAMEYLTSKGYERIGMDHFAKPEDKLSKAQAAGTLHRNFQGYTVQSTPDLIGFGVSAISDVAGCYSQNAKELGEYDEALKGGKLPVIRGFELSEEDLVRRSLITELMCNLKLDFDEFEGRYPSVAPFARHFEEHLGRLNALRDEGHLSYDDASIEMAGHAWPLVRLVGLAFDDYARRDSSIYSQVV